jgi:hypothetical protein
LDDPRQTYSCQGNGYLDDPYEGELFTFFVQFFGGISSDDVEQIWRVKAPQLVKKEYNIGNVGPITVQEGSLSLLGTFGNFSDNVRRILVLQS